MEPDAMQDPQYSVTIDDGLSQKREKRKKREPFFQKNASPRAAGVKPPIQVVSKGCNEYRADHVIHEDHSLFFSLSLFLPSRK
jgi:hypothetical protein